MADEKDLDPRFDPAFQRGYSGDVVTQRRRPSIGTPTVTPAGQVGRPTPPYPVPTRGAHSAAAAPANQGQDSTSAAATIGAPPAANAGVAPAEPTAASARLDSIAGVGGPDDAEPEERSRFNPFLLALIIIAIVLIAVGIWAAQFVMQSFGSDGTAFTSYFILLLASFGAPLSITLGVATLVGVLFVFASRWRR
jgi:hypothetical protein